MNPVTALAAMGVGQRRTHVLEGVTTATSRDAQTHDTIEEIKVLLIHEALARSQHEERLREAKRHTRAARLAHARRLQRRAERASRRARAALAAVH